MLRSFLCLTVVFYARVYDRVFGILPGAARGLFCFYVHIRARHIFKLSQLMVQFSPIC